VTRQPSGRGLVGNDVVDLGDPDSAGALGRPRFLDRVLGPAEREALARAVEPLAWLWACFAVKEAAYKLRAKQAPRVVLAHRRFEVAPDLASVCHEGVRLPAEVRFGEGYVHAWVWSGEVPPRVAVRARPEGGDPSALARRLLLEELGSGPGLAVVRDPLPGSWDGLGPPRAERAGLPLGLDVSLSHDGGYVACAVAGAAPF
jgi:phosphopantetheinyl transferase (holo-ACP synthase)